jgi:hypothetical protein
VGLNDLAQNDRTFRSLDSGMRERRYAMRPSQSIERVFLAEPDTPVVGDLVLPGRSRELADPPSQSEPPTLTRVCWTMGGIFAFYSPRRTRNKGLLRFGAARASATTENLDRRSQTDR